MHFSTSSLFLNIHVSQFQPDCCCRANLTRGFLAFVSTSSSFSSAILPNATEFDFNCLGEDAGFIGVIGARFIPMGDCLKESPGARSEWLGASQPLHRVMVLGLLSLQGTQLQLPGGSLEAISTLSSSSSTSSSFFSASLTLRNTSSTDLLLFLTHSVILLGVPKLNSDESPPVERLSAELVTVMGVEKVNELSEVVSLSEAAPDWLLGLRFFWFNRGEILDERLFRRASFRGT